MFLLLGYSISRQRGDHLLMTKPGTARPVVIKMDKDLGEDIIRSNMRTIGITRSEFEEALKRVRRQK